MKQYKLINKKTGEENICTKIEYFGFDYFIDNNIKGKEGWNYNYGLKKIDNLPFSYPEHSTEWNVCRKMIATNNPDIIPLVIEEEEWIDETTESLTDEMMIKTSKMCLKAGYNKSQQTHPFTEQDMIEFLEWCNFPIHRESGVLGFSLRVRAQFPDYKQYTVIDEKGHSIYPIGKFLTTKELLEAWKEQRIETVYYNE